MEQQIFRKKNLDRISSSDELHNYMRVTNPKLWMLLTAVIVLVVGFIVFASVVKMDNTIKATAVVQNQIDATNNNSITSYAALVIPKTHEDTVKTGMLVRFADEEWRIISIISLEEEDATGILVPVEEEKKFA